MCSCVFVCLCHTYTFPYTHQGGIPPALLLVHSYKKTTPAAAKKAAAKKGGGAAKKPKKGGLFLKWGDGGDCIHTHMRV